MKPSLFFGGDDHYGFIQTLLGEEYDRKKITNRCLQYYDKTNPKYWDQIITVMNWLAFKKLNEENQFEPISVLTFIAEEYDKENELPSKILFDYLLSKWQFPHPINTTQKIKNDFVDVSISDLKKFKPTKPYGSILNILRHLHIINKDEAYLSDSEFYWIGIEFYKSKGEVFNPSNIKKFTNVIYQQRLSGGWRDYEDLKNRKKTKTHLSYPKGFLRNSSLLSDDNTIYPKAKDVFIGLNHFALNNISLVDNSIKESYKNNFEYDIKISSKNNKLSYDYSNYLYDEKNINTWLANIQIYPDDKNIFEHVSTPKKAFDSIEYERIKISTQLQRISVLDKLTITRTRTEQNLLRNFLFKNTSDTKCCICHKNYPIRFLATAHIKKRTECNDDEKKDLNVVMPACKFGCDTLYEDGYIIVKDGKIKNNIKVKNSTSDLIGYISLISDNDCLYWHKNSIKYFEHHEKKNI